MQHLNGEQAVAYMRFRHDWCSDPCRIMRQQQVLHALIDKVKGDRVNTLVHLGDLLGVFRKYVQTDFTDSELVSIANYYQGMAEFGAREQSSPLHRRRESARLRRLTGSRRGRACAFGRDDVGHAAERRCRRPTRSRWPQSRPSTLACRRRERQRGRGRGAPRCNGASSSRIHHW